MRSTTRRNAARASTSSYEASAACGRRCRDCRRTSTCGRSSVVSWSTRGCTASAPSPKPPNTSSGRPTSCPATSTTGSSRSRPSPTHGCGRGSPRCSSSTSPTTCSRGSWSPTVPGSRSPPRKASRRTVRCKSSRSCERTPPEPIGVSSGPQAERELKFVPEGDFDLSTAGDFGVDVTVERTDTLHQHATYYDSADYRLTRAGASLRHRDDDGWTVKLPQSADVALVRNELHVDGQAGD